MSVSVTDLGLAVVRRRPHPPAPAATAEYVRPELVDGRLVYRRGRYRTGRLDVLLSRHVRIRGDLLLEFDPAEPAGSRHARERRQAAVVCSGLLAAAKQELERRHADLPVVANLLGLADRMLVSLYSPAILRLRVLGAEARLAALTPRAAPQLAVLRTVKQSSFHAAGATADPAPGDLDAVRTALKDALQRLHADEEQALLEEDLQCSRLVALVAYVAVGWLLLMAAVPLVLGVQTGPDGDTVVWPLVGLGHGTWLDLLAGALGLSVVGAVGGVVSGLLGVRDARATLPGYRSSMVRLALKPVVGAVAALTLHLFLAAGVVSGVAITGSGTYVVAAFLAGFSERVLLRVLETRADAVATTVPAKA